MNDSEKAEKEPSTAKQIIQGSRALEDTSQIPVSCATCVRQFPMDECFGLKMMERLATAKKQGIEFGCKHYMPRREVKT